MLGGNGGRYGRGRGGKCGRDTRWVKRDVRGDEAVGAGDGRKGDTVIITC